MNRAIADTETVRSRLAEMLPELRQQYGVRKLTIFESFARGEQTADSDLDLLVEFDRAPGMITFMNLQHLLSDRLGVRVEMATQPMIGPRLAPGVEKDLVTI